MVSEAITRKRWHRAHLLRWKPPQADWGIWKLGIWVPGYKILGSLPVVVPIVDVFPENGRREQVIFCSRINFVIFFQGERSPVKKLKPGFNPGEA